MNFSYDDENYVLQNVTAKLSSDTGFVALVGKSGCGKSTLVKLLAGQLEHEQGRITIGDMDYSDLLKRDLTKHVTRIGHDSHIFEGTVRDNLQMASEQKIDDEDMIKVLKDVKLYEEIKDRDGLNMKLQSMATNLSGGQKQRLALARALLRDPQMFIFDEATSNIDVESEEIIFHMIEQIAICGEIS